MDETPVNILILKMAVPNIVSMLVTSIYNITDTFFVSHIGASAMASVGITFPVMALIQAIGNTFGIGSGTFISRSLGNKDVKSAEQVAAVAFFTAVFMGFILTLFGLFYIDKLVILLGATETVAPYAKEYGTYILIGAPYMCGSFVLSIVLRSQGNALNSMIGISIGSILNIILVPICIFYLDMGVSGAGLAAITSQFISFAILYIQSNYIVGSIKIRFINFKPSFMIYKEIFRTGMPTLYRNGLMSIATILINTAASTFGNFAIAAVSIVTKIISLTSSVVMGFGQGYMPICGYNYGAKNYKRVLEGFWFCAKITVVASTLFGLIGFIFAPNILNLFGVDNFEVIKIGTNTLRSQCLIMPLQGFAITVNFTLQSLGYGFKSSLAAIGRQGLFLIPVILTLPDILGITGIEISQAIADFADFILASILIVSVLRHLIQMSKNQDRYIKQIR